MPERQRRREVPLMFVAHYETLAAWQSVNRPALAVTSLVAASQVLCDIPVLAGSDTGVPGVLLGISSQMELVLLVDAGLTTAEALATATINPARAIGRVQDQGTIQRGKLADLLVLDADPLADIRNIIKIHLVIKGGVANN